MDDSGRGLGHHRDRRNDAGPARPQLRDLRRHQGCRYRRRGGSYNTPAQHFYQRYGFYKIGEEQGSRVPLDILEKYIGYDR